MEKQRLTTDCGICSLAMLAGINYEEAIAIAGDDFDPLKGMKRFEKSLEKLGYIRQIINGDDVGDYTLTYRQHCISPQYYRQFAWGHKALVTLPSLNYLGGTHMIYYDGWKVFDPSPLKTYENFTDLLPDELIIMRPNVKRNSPMMGKSPPDESGIL